ncbi:MAG: serine/threonine-protein kinase [Planctomycetota bacterium]
MAGDSQEEHRRSRSDYEQASENEPAGHAPGLALQDLTTERLLLSTPRTETYGRMCPTLNGIPLLAKIGQGGMGAVYYGIHPRLRSEVAVKVLPFQLAEQDPGMIRRFFREAQLAAAVHSPHLVNVMDVNEDSGLFFLVMEYVSGESAGHYLKSVLAKGARGLSELDALDLTIAATEGLWAAHANNVIHRDIKPDNIMIPYQSRTSKELDLQRAKLTDLGLARNEDSQQSLTGNQSAMGTPGYMAPEQAMDAKTADKRSDVFSMGATLYSLLSGHPPFRGETVMKTLIATMSEVHVPIIKLRQDVSRATNDMLEKCLAKKQEHRYSDARQLLGVLQDCRRLLAASGPAEASVTCEKALVPEQVR